ncbi:hypothetical protein FQN50_005517 [Emmonsiellopsis sp. PD_5]|nr:hypothetical protein FQN50_005517 [Emmonsiellopsis sp. PD_5]
MPAIVRRQLRTTGRKGIGAALIFPATSTTPAAAAAHGYFHVYVQQASAYSSLSHGLLSGSGPAMGGWRRRRLNQSCVHHQQHGFNMHDYLRGLVELYRKRAWSSSSTCTRPRSGGAPEQRHTGTQPQPLPVLRGTITAATTTPQPQPPTAIPSQGGILSHRRAYSTSTSSSDSSSSTHPTTNQKPIPSLNFDRISTLIPNQSPTGTTSLWYIAATAALLAFHQEATVGELWRYIIQRCADESANNKTNVSEEARQQQLLIIARRIRESCLKASVLVGFPRAINALTTLHTTITTTHPHTLLPALLADSAHPLRANLSTPTRYARGKEFFSRIYSKHTERVLESMGASSGGDLSYFAVSSVYGDLMAEMSVVGAAETGVLEFVCCLGDGVGMQGKGHFFGCRNLGVSGAEMMGVIELVREIAGQVGVEFPGDREEFLFLKRAAAW